MRRRGASARLCVVLAGVLLLVLGVVPTPPGLRATAPAAAARLVAASLHNVRVPTPDAGGRVRVPVTDVVPPHLPSPGPPAGWELKEFAGEASLELTRNQGRVALRVRSERTSFAVHRDVVLDVKHYAMLAWSWKVVRLPAGGDVRDPKRNDQAAQVYVIFPRWPSPQTSSDIIGYIWDSHAPVGTTVTHPKLPNIRLIVVESGRAHMDSWRRQVRNVAEDYRALFGRQPPRVGKVALMVDTDDTRGEAESLFGDLTFFRPGVASMEIAVTMLR